MGRRAAARGLGTLGKEALVGDPGLRMFPGRGGFKGRRGPLRGAGRDCEAGAGLGLRRAGKGSGAGAGSPGSASSAAATFSVF